MRDYSPKRRTALVLAGSGTAGAYHAGALKALDENGVKLDLVVGTGAGTVTAAFAALAAGERLYGAGGYWDGAGWDRFYRLRPALRLGVLLLAVAFGVFLLPVLLALVAGLLFPLLLVADLVAPQWTATLVETLRWLPGALRTPYLAALAAPVFVLSLAAAAWCLIGLARERRRFAEAFESIFTARPAAAGLQRWLAELARASGSPGVQTVDQEAGRRYVGALLDNLGQPGFRELILRACDLDTGGVASFVVLQEPHRGRYLAARARAARAGGHAAFDLGAAGGENLVVPAVLSGALLPPPLTAPVRVTFPRGAAWAGETHRLGDGLTAGGCGLSEALLAGAEQVIVACLVPEVPSPPRRRRGPRAAVDALLTTLERQAVERDLAGALRINRMVETLGHRTEDGARAWEDPTSGRVYREVAIYVIRPERRNLGALDLDGAGDPAREARETPEDLAEQGYRDAYHLFVEPVLGATAEPIARAQPAEHTIGL